MKPSQLISSLALGVSCIALGSCNDDDPETAAAALRSGGALGKGNPPEIIARERIDRIGRPAITAALISTFAPEGQETVRDAYNRSGQLNEDFRDTIQQSLAILDSLDGTCGNQLLAGADEAAPRYTPLASVLLDDQLYLHSDRAANPSIYLGLEIEFVRGADVVSGGSGGRAPGEDVIERSYSVLAAGVTSGVDDGVETDDATHDLAAFPFLAEPQ